MEHISEIKQLLQQAINAAYTSEKWEEKAFPIAQRIGLQGEKRRERYQSVKSHNLVNYLKSDSFDLYGINLTVHHIEVDVPEITSIKAYFEMVLEKTIGQYDKLHTIANKLVMANARSSAKCLYCFCDELACDIKYFRRTIMEGNIVNWDPKFMLLHQVTAEDVHDNFEAKEKSIDSYPS